MPIRVKGVKGLLRRLRALERSASNTDRALLRGGALIAAEAQRNVSGRPGLRVQSGRLRNSIVAVLVRKGEVRVGTNVVYGPIHEFGGFAGRGHAVRIPARPYLRPAFRKKKAAVTRIVREFYTGPLSFTLGFD